MPANKNATIRYILLDELLGNRTHNYSLDDLKEKVNEKLEEAFLPPVGRRTIEKDIDYLENNDPFYVEIERYSVIDYDRDRQKYYTKRCLWYKYPSFSILKRELSKKEDDLLSETLAMLSQFDGLPNLKSLEKLRKERRVKKNERQIISFSKNLAYESSDFFGDLFTAISEEQAIEVHYRKFMSEDESVFTVHPYLLKEYNRRWYLIARWEEKNKDMNYALDRIIKIVPLPAHKYVKYEGDINKLFDDIIGVTMSDTPVYQIIFWVADGSKNYVDTKPLHKSQKQFVREEEAELRVRYPQLEGGLFFQIECKENYELIRELSSFGKDLLVLSPKLIQDKVLERLRDMQDEYSKIL